MNKIGCFSAMVAMLATMIMLAFITFDSKDKADRLEARLQINSEQKIKNSFEEWWDKNGSNKDREIAWEAFREAKKG